MCDDAGTVRQHPLKESLILWIVAHLMIKVEPQGCGDVQRYSDESNDRKNVPPIELPPRATARLLLLRGGELGRNGRDGRRRGDIRLQRQQLGIKVVDVGFQAVGVGRLARRQNVPTRRLACRVNTCNRHSVGEPNRGW
ncbi:hypothetical protein ACIA5C_33865 [Actinoplanes sp. NPDC051343]|uniref:hypothetical protein n=1 Tax=Actinoplanes sp. NPDC051343 TaxID=3363906 RepID=UPI0037B52172